MIAFDVEDDSAELGVSGTPYTFVKLVGSGASSEVFEVRDARGRPWALKLLRFQRASSRESRARFLREAVALACVSHPNLVPVVDAGTADGDRPYFVMPLLSGETLRERLTRSGPMSASDACAMLLDVLSGLDAAHREGIVHRDVKPANVFLAKGDAILLDFGVAKILQGAAGPGTPANHVVGTPRYLAPEQILGGEVDARTDVYAAGITLFEALTGRDPFGARGAGAQLRAHVFGKPSRLRDVTLATSELDEIVARALERTPGYRFPSAAAFGAALARSRARYLRAPDLRRQAQTRTSAS